MLEKIKENASKIIFAVLYLALFIPHLYSIYYSVPASDDFAMTLGRDAYENIFSEFFACVKFFWMERGGTMIGFIVEVLFNPLNIHQHLGHWYGIYMSIAFLLCFAAIMYGVNVTVKYMLGQIEHLNTISSIITFLIAFMLLENYYYVEVYNWYVGMVAYPFAMDCLFLTFVYIIRFAETGDRKFYIGMIITGIVAANTTALDVPLGIFFLYIVLLKKGFDPHIASFIKKYIPLMVYIGVGLITLAAPGNYARQSQYTEAVSIGISVKQSVADVVFWGMAVLKERPVTLIVMALLLIAGVYSHSMLKKKPDNLVLFIAAAISVWIGCILPYVYGRGMTRTYLDVRMQYVLDYLIEIGIGVGCVIAGQWIGYLIKIDLKRIALVSGTTICVLGLIALVITGRYKSTVAFETYSVRKEIKMSYVLWDGILSEIEYSPEANVVVSREWNVPWNKYFLYSGLEPGEEYAVPLDSFYDSLQILPNVYYKKNSIIVNYPR